MILTEPLYLGGVPPLATPPPELWSLSGKGRGQGGLVGCVRDLVINGLSVQLGELARWGSDKKYQDIIDFFQESRPRVSEARVPKTRGPVHCGQSGGSMSKWRTLHVRLEQVYL